MANGPVLLRGFENDHKDVLRADAGAFAKQLRDPPEQCFLLFKSTGVEHGDLDIYDIGAPRDAIGITVAEVRSVMLRNGHELVVFRDAQRLAHRPVKAVQDRLPVGVRLSGAQRNMKKRHRNPSTVSELYVSCPLHIYE